MAARRRLDAELVRRGLATSRADASATIGDGRVLVNVAIADKPARLVAPGDAVVVEGPPARFVGRGGEKLDAALDAFSIDVAGLRANGELTSAGGAFDGRLNVGGPGLTGLLRFDRAGDVQRIALSFDANGARLATSPAITIGGGVSDLLPTVAPTSATTTALLPSGERL